MKTRQHVLFAATALLAAPTLAQDPAKSPNGGRPEIHDVEEMRRIGGYTAPGAHAYADLAAEAGGKLWPVTLYYRCQAVRERRPLKAPAPKPVEVFDRVYSIGTAENNIWAIDTNDGILLLDALSSEANARDVIVANMKTLGLDPRRIRIIVITHNHLDHFGGAAYLKALSGAKIGMSRADWTGKPMMGTLPVKAADDFFIEDGQTITLGGRSVTALLTPGHTPGTISLLFSVSDHGVPHMASLFGGQGSPRDVAALMTFRHSLDHFADYTDWMQADVVLSNHTVGDDGLTRVAALQRRRAGEPNPYVVGREGVIRYDAEWRGCLSADIDQAIAGGGIKPGTHAIKQTGGGAS
ncbi:metallo-beta-lactamase class B [Sphingomonas sp. SORGH_AS802]|uniref:MBL fold metallo-hydrolase n=1 Tax=unclassified Sphingomonas TaxID=196159 RepID=UPI00285FF907|nr:MULTISPECIES: MBL fold metallo-hydrolase [unclassified Sphingomonas]MDR6126712.1 metallo-beta-lactamase class B [Sphingomonas sp. SORGH_AS_0438]MDR6134922.1 metallo-beta-lactamase class B [Sphingomonas sp. SORGH_AS_0802]